ncbi:MAG: amino acid adenylation domain-containing protein, partial [Gemmobacter sp.]|nr:amino acid adenylation domain-containing protein [Gemmobacter sp.]
FAPATIARYNRGFLSLLEGVAAAPETLLSNLPLVSAAEEAHLLALGTGPVRDDGPNPPEPHELIAGFAETTPDAIAVIWQGRAMTYGELNARANRLARHLRALGVRAGDAVAVATGRNAAMIEALVAVNRAGAAIVQMPTDAPLDRVTGILQDSASRVLLTLSEREDLMGLPGAVAVDRDAGWRDLPDGPPEPWVNPISYIVYTSGTTGAPKGTLNTHLGLLNMCRWQAGDFGMDARCSQTVAANPAFDAIMWEIWPALSVGGRLIILEADDLADVARLQAALDRYQPSHFWLPTGLMEAMCSSGLRLPRSVRSVSTGGDRLQGYCLPGDCGLPLANIYGPSEAAVITVCVVLQPHETSLAPIGRPVPNTCVYVMDDRGRLLPEGAVGELCLSGPSLGPGYLNRPELTAQKFVANPYAKPGHEILYRTGDLARWRPDGRLECLGRTDFQIKLRGYRIEPQEIAAVLLAQPGIQAAFVEAIDSGARQLVAFVVAEPGQDTALMEPPVKDALARVLPSYMMPRRYVWLEALPLTDRGKIDRRALAALAPEPGRQVNTASPRDDLELKLYDIWSSVLLHPDIGLRDNFFEIGGTSLSAIKIVHRINAELGASLAVTEMIAHPTIEELGGVLRSGRERRRPQNPICFRKGAGAVNVVCVHPGGGTAFAYLSLAKELPEDHGVWGIQSVGVYPGDEMLPDIGAMADHYIGLIDDLLDRPLVITGASFGGLVAYEMVRRLHLAGNDRATAVMLDALGSDDPAITQNEKLADADEFRAKLITYNGMFPGIDDAQIDQYHRIYNHNTLASRRWHFRRTEGRVILVQAIRGRSRAQLRYLRFFWQMRAKGRFLFKCTAGDHSTTLEGEDVRRIARIIAKVLAGRLMPVGGM